MINRGFSFEVIIETRFCWEWLGSKQGPPNGPAGSNQLVFRTNGPCIPETTTRSGPEFTDKYLNILFIPVLSLTYLRFNLKARPGATCQNSNMGLTFFAMYADIRRFIGLCDKMSRFRTAEL